jgi:hypothetical protein
VKRPYDTELAALDDTYRTALEVDVAPLQAATQELGRGPAIFVGSGGSMAAATLAARLHQEICRQPGTACTTLEALDTPTLAQCGALLFSSSAKHEDARQFLLDLRRARFVPSAVLTHRTAADLRGVAGADTRIVSLPALSAPDGFLATGSLLQSMTLLLRAYLPEITLPPGIKTPPEEAPLRAHVLVLTPPSLACIATDIEVRLVESGLADVQVSDYRNFAHGRHTGITRRLSDTTVIALSDNGARPLANATIEALPKEIDLRRWHGDESWEATIVDLLVRSAHLAGAAGKHVGLDVARPRVPEFGRRLYHLPLKSRMPQRRSGGIERKLLAAGVELTAVSRARYVDAGQGWLQDLSTQRFDGLVLDYDGTVCWTSQRWSPPDKTLISALRAKMDYGITVGFASGRGRSLYSELRNWVPASAWSRVIVGLYNGAIRVRLDEELPDLRASSPWSEAVVAALGDGLRRAVEERAHQVSVGAIGARAVGSLAADIRVRLDSEGVPARVVSSGHSVDIIEPATSKTAVLDAVREASDGQVLSIGDQGQPGGNDFELLSRTRWSLSVDRCSADPASCWFAGDGDQIGPSLLVDYLDRLRRRRGGFALQGLLIA